MEETGIALQSALRLLPNEQREIIVLRLRPVIGMDCFWQIGGGP